MNMKKNKTALPRLLLLLACVAIIVLALPRGGKQALSYEQGQPWRYPLLTAPFDIPVYLDSLTIREATDSVKRNFAPFVIYSDTALRQSVVRLQESGIPASKTILLVRLLPSIYETGITTATLKKRISGTADRQIRILGSDGSATATDASRILNTDEALKLLTDRYQESNGSTLPLSAEDVERLRRSLSPNIIADAATDSLYMSQALLSISSGQGKIAQGQRIVDRGEIITPQIYTNLNTYEEMLLQRGGGNNQSLLLIAGQTLYLLILFGALYLYLYLYRRHVFDDIRMIVFLMSLITLIVLFAALMAETFTLGIYIVPFAVVPVMVLIFIDSRTAVFSMVITVMAAALIAIYQYQFIFMELTAGCMATFSLRQLTARSQLLRTSAVTFLTYCLTFTVSVLLHQGTLEGLDPKLFLSYGINAVLLTLTYVLIFLIEKMFGFTSMVTLVELSDINNTLLRRLAEEAPGTFQHSIQVSTLATEAARAIGANPTLTRTGALYHDIGKLNGPVFFTENQHGVNPHDGLDPSTSARKIIGHVVQGNEMAMHAKLPTVIRHFILEHHGRGLAKYFYNTACNNAEGDIDATPFRYPGPNPQSRETAILMMADAVEAASRSLKEYTPEAIDALVEKIINTQIADGLLRESPISFLDVEKVKETFKRRLANIYHTRVAYPERKTVSTAAK